MKRREFLKTTALGVAGATAACGPAEETAGSSSGDAPAVQTRQRIRWRLASSFPRGLDTIYGAAEVFSEELARLSEGRLEVRPYPAGELVPGLQVLDAVQQGTAQIGHTAAYYYTGKNPALAFDTGVPFGLSPRQHAAWIFEGGGQELMAPLFSDFGVIALPGGNTGTQMGGWFKREIQTAEDLRGLKMRIPGQGGEVMSRLGVTVQVLASGDIYPALERGTIDATEWVGPYDDEQLGFHKAASYYYYPGWWEPSAALSLLVNQSAWDSLASEDQQLFRVAARIAGDTMQARYDAQNPPALARLLESGTQLRRYSDDILQAARRESEALLNELAAADPAFEKLYASWRSFRAASFKWFSTSELAYASFAFPSAEA